MLTFNIQNGQEKTSVGNSFKLVCESLHLFLWLADTMFWEIGYLNNKTKSPQGGSSGKSICTFCTYFVLWWMEDVF